MEKNKESDSVKKDRSNQLIACPWSIGLIIFLLSVFFVISPNLILLIVLMSPFLGIWAIIVCYDIGNIKRNGTWNMMEKFGIILTFIATFLLVLSALGALNILNLGETTTYGLFSLGISFTIIAPVIMLIGQCRIFLRLSIALSLAIFPLFLLGLIILITRHAGILFWLPLTGIFSLIISLLISFDNKKQIEENTTGYGENNV